MQAYNFFAPQLMSSTPYGYDPAQMVQQGQQLNQQGQGLFNWGNMALQEGFDPQDAAYGRYAGKLTNQVRAGQGARGIQMSPHGAGLEGETMGEFNNDWRMQELQRQQLGAQTAASLYGQGSQMIGQGSQIQQSVPQNIGTYANMLQQLGINAMSPQMWSAQNYGNMFSAGAGAQNDNYTSQLKAHEIDSNADSSFWGGIGKLGGQLGSAAIMASERELKTNIKELCKDHRGLGIYSFEYINDASHEQHVGYMVDEVELVVPNAVIEFNGRKYVDLSVMA